MNHLPDVMKGYEIYCNDEKNFGKPDTTIYTNYKDIRMEMRSQRLSLRPGVIWIFSEVFGASYQSSLDVFRQDLVDEGVTVGEYFALDWIETTGAPNIETYTAYQKGFFEAEHTGMTVGNHKERDEDREYWTVLLGDVYSDAPSWKGKKALDVGCGCGRNLKNLLDIAEFERVDGCDISEQNIIYSKKYAEDIHGAGKSQSFETSGWDLKPALSEEYDFVMSSAVFIHIPDYYNRMSLIEESFRVLKPGGIVSHHFIDMEISNGYTGTWGLRQQKEYGQAPMNCRVEDPRYLLRDFYIAGFKDITVTMGTDLFTTRPAYYVRAVKPPADTTIDRDET